MPVFVLSPQPELSLLSELRTAFWAAAQFPSICRGHYGFPHTFQNMLSEWRQICLSPSVHHRGVEQDVVEARRQGRQEWLTTSDFRSVFREELLVPQCLHVKNEPKNRKVRL